MNRVALLISGLVFFLSACEKGGDQPICCTNIDTKIVIHYTDASGEDLINSSEQYAEDKIKVYYKKDGVFEYAFQGNLDFPNMYFVDEDLNGDLQFHLFPSNEYDGNFSETLIEFNGVESDTIRAEFQLDGNNEICTRVWYNGVEMDGQEFEIVK